MNSLPVPVFIVGCARSGTTITASLLNRLPRVHIAKETGFLGQNIELLRNVADDASLRSLVDTVNSWLQVEKWDARASADDFRRFCETYEIQGPAAFIYYVWQLECPVTWTSLEYIGDNTPLYATCLPVLLELMPGARFIHMVRDPRDVVCSIIKMRFGADDPVAAALEWHMTIGCWMMAERLIDPSARIECRYEDLCTAPAETLGRLAGFLGRPSSESCAALQLHDQDVLSGRVRSGRVAELAHHTRLAEPLSAGRIGRYQAELNASQIQQIEAVLQYGLKAYGYHLTQWQTSPLTRSDLLFLTRALVRNLIARGFRKLRGQ